ncbi:hypothetical protein BE18_30125 [Sorangium cellulosum]|uniref:Uncharacterized protein n=1 Tax=Sorangium cellulosum TaxID=56 RepID=A0A150SGQ4_SORCE|nr:hypothetical protein BE18_30125 [Sorangium cellulosum]
MLATELITVADAREKQLRPKKLPEAIGRSKGRLAAAVATLEALTRPHGGDPVETKTKPKADRLLDNAWSGTFDWLGGWCKLPPERNPSLEEAKELFKLLYPDGLSFTRLPYKLEWKESKARLDAIRSARHERTFKKLGGEAFLAHLEEAHEAYGRALHITAPKPESAPTGDVRAAFLATLAALRDYAARVAAHADPDVPGSEEVSAALLAPLGGQRGAARAAGGVGVAARWIEQRGRRRAHRAGRAAGSGRGGPGRSGVSRACGCDVAYVVVKRRALFTRYVSADQDALGSRASALVVVAFA